MKINKPRSYITLRHLIEYLAPATCIVEEMTRVIRPSRLDSGVMRYDDVNWAKLTEVELVLWMYEAKRMDWVVYRLYELGLLERWGIRCETMAAGYADDMLKYTPKLLTKLLRDTTY